MLDFKFIISNCVVNFCKNLLLTWYVTYISSFGFVLIVIMWVIFLHLEALVTVPGGNPGESQNVTNSFSSVEYKCN